VAIISSASRPNHLFKGEEMKRQPEKSEVQCNSIQPLTSLLFSSLLFSSLLLCFLPSIFHLLGNPQTQVVHRHSISLLDGVVRPFFSPTTADEIHALYKALDKDLIVMDVEVFRRNVSLWRQAVCSEANNEGFFEETNLRIAVNDFTRKHNG